MNCPNVLRHVAILAEPGSLRISVFKEHFGFARGHPSTAISTLWNMFQRIDGLRTLELGAPGSDLQKRLNALVIAGAKTGTSSIDDGEYAEANETFETVGERQWLIDEIGNPIALIEYTAVEWVPFSKVSWEFVESEGEGFESIEHWQTEHREFWKRFGVEVTADTDVICYSFKVIERL